MGCKYLLTRVDQSFIHCEIIYYSIMLSITNYLCVGMRPLKSSELSDPNVTGQMIHKIIPPKQGRQVALVLP